MNDAGFNQASVRPATSDSDLEEARRLFVDYANSLRGLHCFAHFDEELSRLADMYGPPQGGLFLAWVDGRAAGCCAFRPLPESDHVDACEMKRLFVAEPFRGLGLGHLLVEGVMEAARSSGYSCMLLDTLDEMETARALYGEMGFVEIPPYLQSPIPGAHHLKVEL